MIYIYKEYGEIATESTDTLLYSDYYERNSNFYEISLLTKTRFLLNPFIDLEYYLTYFDISKVYQLKQYDIYNLTVSFERSNLSVVKNINIKNGIIKFFWYFYNKNFQNF